eukprot:353237-Chlamydomonas_euryale.AAC.3
MRSRCWARCSCMRTCKGRQTHSPTQKKRAVQPPHALVAQQQQLQRAHACSRRCGIASQRACVELRRSPHVWNLRDSAQLLMCDASHTLCTQAGIVVVQASRLKIYPSCDTCQPMSSFAWHRTDATAATQFGPWRATGDAHGRHRTGCMNELKMNE